MKPQHLFSLCVLLGANLVAPRAFALISEHGSERVGCSGWSAPLTEIVNDPARVSGEIGPLAPSAHFHYLGDLAAFQRVLAKYAALPQPQRILYLQTGFGRQHDFELTITSEGNGFLLFNAGGRIPLDQLKIPAGLAVEILPDAGVPVDPQEKAQLQIQRQRMKDFLAARKTSPGEAPDAASTSARPQ